MSSTSREYIKHVYRVSLVVPRCTKEFAEGLGVGVLASQEVTFILPKGQNYQGAAILSDAGNALLNETVQYNLNCLEECPATEAEYQAFLLRAGRNA